MRRKHRNNMTEAEAREMLEECMEVLFHRHCYCSNGVKFVTVTAEGRSFWQFGSTALEEGVCTESKISLSGYVTPSGKACLEEAELMGVRIKRLEKLATRLHRKEQYFDGLRAAARIRMRPPGLCNRIPFRIGPFDQDPQNGEPPGATDSWPPFARYDSEGLLGMYIVERSMTTSTPPSVTPERTGHAGAMDEKAPTPAERARLSSETRGCESLPAFCKVSFIL
ncbi:Proteasome subunit beta type-4 [Perkinsus olseni]|uniref:Proteasome subunit beta type-4 n=1 Tax=Perkinsus olseni TaxID=32597 RepID=A0A7J6MS75_PEROL|nr:Proteasome subunit beta type-4 [Perkinsus olseni]